jgi:hypothetical protein
MDKKAISGKEVIRGFRRGRTISIVGLSTAFLASALSVLTANIRGESGSRSLFILTAFLWLLAIVGMILWLYGRSVLGKSAAGGGWLAQNVQPEVPGQEWAAFMVELSEPAGAEDLYVECIRSLRSVKPAFPIRADLSWLNAEGDDYTYAVIMFYPASEEAAAVTMFENCLHSSPQSRSIIGAERGSRIREDYYRRLGACGSSMWLQDS